jgi:hypothetical protein
MAAKLPSHWSHWEVETFISVTDGIPAIVENPYVQSLYHDALWNFEIPLKDSGAAYNELVDFMREQYDLEFADDFDWEEYREWYSMQ